MHEANAVLSGGILHRHLNRKRSRTRRRPREHAIIAERHSRRQRSAFTPRERRKSLRRRERVTHVRGIQSSDRRTGRAIDSRGRGRHNRDRVCRTHCTARIVRVRSGQHHMERSHAVRTPGEGSADRNAFVAERRSSRKEGIAAIDPRRQRRSPSRCEGPVVLPSATGRTQFEEPDIDMLAHVVDHAMNISVGSQGVAARWRTRRDCERSRTHRDSVGRALLRERGRRVGDRYHHAERPRGGRRSHDRSVV